MEMNSNKILNLLFFGTISLFHKKIKYVLTFFMIGFCVYYLGKQCANHDRRHNYPSAIINK